MGFQPIVVEFIIVVGFKESMILAGYTVNTVEHSTFKVGRP
jgi:hypothetical protein